jgi:hypothetical protein
MGKGTNPGDQTENLRVYQGRLPASGADLDREAERKKSDRLEKFHGG